MPTMPLMEYGFGSCSCFVFVGFGCFNFNMLVAGGVCAKRANEHKKKNKKKADSGFSKQRQTFLLSAFWR